MSLTVEQQQQRRNDVSPRETATWPHVYEP